MCHINKKYIVNYKYFPIYKDNLSIVVVTYNPDDNFICRLKEICKLSDSIIIVDNASINQKYLYDSVLSLSNNTTFICLSNNYGIAKALNVGIKKSQELHKDWIITFDQDSLPVTNIIDYYNKAIGLLNNYKIGLIGVNFNSSKKEYKDFYKQTYTIITSGTLHNIKMFDEIGYYDENLFIDYVDFEFVLRCSLNKFYCVRINENLLSHKIGSPIKKFGLISDNHNALRKYYMMRNHIYISKKYFRNFPIFIIKKNIYLIKQLILFLIVEKDKKRKILAYLKGLKDGIYNK